jgi:hypothetical protein
LSFNSDGFLGDLHGLTLNWVFFIRRNHFVSIHIGSPSAFYPPGDANGQWALVTYQLAPSWILQTARIGPFAPGFREYLCSLPSLIFALAFALLLCFSCCLTGFFFE